MRRPRFLKKKTNLKLLLFKNPFLKSKSLKTFFKNKNVVFKNKLLFYINFKNLIKKNKICKQIINFKIKNLFFVDNGSLNYSQLRKNYIKVLLNRFFFKKLKYTFNIKLFVFKLFLSLQKRKNFLLNFFKKSKKNKRLNAYKTNRYYRVILKRTKWIYFIGLFDINNVMLIHFDYLSLNIRFSRRVRIDFYKVWHKMIYKFFTEMMKINVLRVSELFFFKRARRKNKIKMSWVRMFCRQHKKAFRKSILIQRPVKVFKLSFSKKTTKNKKMKR